MKMNQNQEISELKVELARVIEKNDEKLEKLNNERLIRKSESNRFSGMSFGLDSLGKNLESFDKDRIDHMIKDSGKHKKEITEEIIKLKNEIEGLKTYKESLGGTIHALRLSEKILDEKRILPIRNIAELKIFNNEDESKQRDIPEDMGTNL